MASNSVSASASSRCTIANESTIGKSGQRALTTTTVGVAGLGGVGGIAFQLLVRAGIGTIKISDSGFFEESNANRQALWTRKTDGRKKTDVAKEFAASINPACKIISFPEISVQSSPKFAQGCSSVIDATDRAHSRLAVWRGCKKQNTPYIFASALGAKGMLTVFDGKKDFEREFGMKNKRYKNFLTCDHSLPPVANLIGCLAAQQALNIALSKKTISFPQVASIDAFAQAPEQIVIHQF
ncbi:MAG: ThiF family adenylyltransferase [Candidatus Micrarchaeota archaeon]|nr:ThiF family adenylyltransferase [Candidatus Micrarchaeota archaeon]